MATTAEHSRPIAPALPARRTLAVLAGTLFVAACAHISVPLFFTPVPMTLQPFAVLLVGLLLGPAMGASTMVAYLLEGAAGLPVFTPQGPGGMLQLLGPTGGYLLSYPLAAGLAGFLGRLGTRRGVGSALLAAAAANLVILLAGAGWLSLLTHATAAAVWHTAILPFLGGDALKVVLAALIVTGWHRTRFHSGFDRAHKPDRA